jgi:hypothetical protein
VFQVVGFALAIFTVVGLVITELYEIGWFPWPR